MLPIELVNRLTLPEYSTYEPNIQRIVLLSTGSFNPVHREHIRMAVLAKKKLESDYSNLHVVASVFSASHHKYLSGKMKCSSNVISSQDRLETIRLGLKEEKEMSNFGDNFACVDSWESYQENFVDFPDVTRSLQQRLDINFGVNKFRVWFLCGLDHAEKCGLFRYGVIDSYGENHSFVCIYRSGTPLSHEALCIDSNVGILVNESDESDEKYGNDSVSSTRIREAARKKDIPQLNKLTYSSVVSLMQDKGIFGLNKI